MKPELASSCILRVQEISQPRAWAKTHGNRPRRHTRLAHVGNSLVGLVLESEEQFREPAPQNGSGLQCPVYDVPAGQVVNGVPEPSDQAVYARTGAAADALV
jgi:hypothetical protein